jgi:hypothetical protein
MVCLRNITVDTLRKGDIEDDDDDDNNNNNKLFLSSSSSSVSPLCRVSTVIFLRQTMSLGNIVLQLF